MDIAIEGFENVLKKAGAKKQNNSANRGNAILRELTIIAEEACNMARDAYPDRQSGGYDDHTRNLRGSICAIIYYGGSEVKRCGFDGFGSAEGEANAEIAANSLDADQTALWEIKVSAGMYYARYVEAKGHKVISHVQGWLTEQLNKLAQDIKDGKI